MTKQLPVIQLWRSLHLTDQVVCDELNASLAEKVSCSLVEHDVLAWLAAAEGQRLRMANLAALLRVTPGGLTRIVDRLVVRGWIERDHPSDSRREVYSILTREGLSAFRSARTTYSRVLQETLADHLDERDLASLDRIMQRLHDRLTSGDPCGITFPR